MEINKQELIAHIYRNGTLAYSYEYDDLGQLTRENNADTNRTYVYTYDTTGNILSKKVYGYTTSSSISTTLYNTYTYDYGKTDWNDLLQGYNGVNFSHDDIGNPLSYYNGSSYEFKWKQGRRLQEAITGGVTYTYTYNDEGIRTAKMFDYNNDGIVDVTHYYHLAGSQILSEEWKDTSEVTHLLVYNYDADGTIMGMSYRNSTYDVQRFESYLFIKNIQGDILHIYDENGNKVVSYTYDAWGNITSTTGTLASTIGKMNPFRYRGYYYDEELGFYYLNSRYYDPKIGRFINADSVMAGANGNVQGYNLFAYSFNNPINMIDISGTWPSWNDVGKFFEKVGNKIADGAKAIGNFLSDNFSAQTITTVVEFEDKKTADFFFFKVIRTDSASYDVESSASKTVTAYANTTNQNAGLKLKAGNISGNIGFGVDSLRSAKASVTFDEITYSFEHKEKIIYGDFSFSISKGNKTKSYTLELNKINIASAVLAPYFIPVMFGDQLVKVYGYG